MLGDHCPRHSNINSLGNFLLGDSQLHAPIMPDPMEPNKVQGTLECQRQLSQQNPVFEANSNSNSGANTGFHLAYNRSLCPFSFDFVICDQCHKWLYMTCWKMFVPQQSTWTLHERFLYPKLVVLLPRLQLCHPSRLNRIVESLSLSASPIPVTLPMHTSVPKRRALLLIQSSVTWRAFPARDCDFHPYSAVKYLQTTYKRHLLSCSVFSKLIAFRQILGLLGWKFSCDF